jgi:hypothetical protein
MNLFFAEIFRQHPVSFGCGALVIWLCVQKLFHKEAVRSSERNLPITSGSVEYRSSSLMIWSYASFLKNLTEDGYILGYVKKPIDFSTGLRNIKFVCDKSEVVGLAVRIHRYHSVICFFVTFWLLIKICHIITRKVIAKCAEIDPFFFATLNRHTYIFFRPLCMLAGRTDFVNVIRTCKAVNSAVGYLGIHHALLKSRFAHFIIL